MLSSRPPWALGRRNRGGPRPRLKYRPVGAGGAYPDWLRALDGRSGVYVIRNLHTEEVLYVGESHTDRLYGTITRHFQSWGRSGIRETPNDPGVTLDRGSCEVAVILMQPDWEKTLAKQNRLIAKLDPIWNVQGRPRPALDEVPF